VQEDDGLSVSANLGDRIQGLDALCHKIVDGLGDIIHLDADMMNASGLVLIEESLDRRAVSIRVKEFNFGVAQFHEDCVHTVFWQWLSSIQGGRPSSLVNR
jgi:hypothetical protein